VNDLAKRGAMMAAGLMLLTAAMAALRAQEATANTNAGVYSETQADRGKAAYVKYCQACHGETMNGVDVAPALVGSTFLGNWVGLSVGELGERVRTTMPQNNPGTLSSATTADLIALILKANGYASGTADLPRDGQLQSMIRIADPKPGG
jgi:S-disulfanyl-L-cysteine oxidoreductase SoxD